MLQRAQEAGARVVKPARQQCSRSGSQELDPDPGQGSHPGCLAGHAAARAGGCAIERGRDRGGSTSLPARCLKPQRHPGRSWVCARPVFFLGRPGPCGIMAHQRPVQGAAREVLFYNFLDSLHVTLYDERQLRQPARRAWGRPPCNTLRKGPQSESRLGLARARLSATVQRPTLQTPFSWRKRPMVIPRHYADGRK